MWYPIQNANKLFVKISKGISSCRILVRALLHSSSWQNHSYVQERGGLFTGEEDVVLWTAKISNLVRENLPEEAIGIYKRMCMSTEKPNYATILSVIRATGQLGSEHMSRTIHGLAVKWGFDSEVSVVTALLGVYSGWDIGIVRKLFDQVPNKDVVLWSAMVSACVKNEEYEEAFELFRKMQLCGMQPNHASVLTVLPACANLGALRFGKEIHGFSIKRVFYSHINVRNSIVDMYAKCRNWNYSVRVFRGMQIKDIVSWRSMICGCTENEVPEKALTLFSEMRFCGVEFDITIIHKLMVASSQLEEVMVGGGLHGLVLKMGYIEVVSIVTALLHMYAKFGEIQSAKILFDHLNNKDLIAWSAMISAYVQNGQPFSAFNVHRQMLSTGEKPNEVTFVSLLQSCSSMAAQQVGESIHAHLIKAGYMSNSFLTSALIDMYCKFGRTKQGKALFYEIPTRDLICWSSMVNGYGINGFGEEALECFLSMLRCGIKPNDVVFISVLAACSHCGLEYEGWRWFYKMEESYGITPKRAHYACMVDMLSRQGNVEGAFEFANSMPIEPDKRIWGAILAGCRKTSGSSEISEIVAKRLISLDPKNTSYHVILSNLYAEQGRWKEVASLRELLDTSGSKKEIGCSMI